MQTQQLSSRARLITGLSALELRSRLGHDISPSEAVAAFAQKINLLNPQFGAFISTQFDAAHASAIELERSAAQQPVGAARPPLWGIPLAHKDLIDVAGAPTTHGSRAFTASPAAEHDAPLAAVLRMAGAINIGKTQVPEFGLAGYSENLIAPPARSPFDASRTAGGSSGGAAVAVALGMLPFAPGSDGGGSIRIPAAVCGVVGLKPTRNLLAADRGQGGSDPLALTVSGPLARTVPDVALLWDAMRADARESTLRALLSSRRVADLLPGTPARPLRIAVSSSSPYDGALNVRVDAAQTATLQAVMDRLRAHGHDVVATDFNYGAEYFELFYDLWQGGFGETSFTAEQLARFGDYARHSWERGHGLGAQRRAQVRSQMQTYGRTVTAQWAQFDFAITPVLAHPAPAIGYFEALDPETNFIKQCEWLPFTSLVNVTGLPAVSVPVGGAPAGGDAPNSDQPQAGRAESVQVIGPAGSEGALLLLAQELAA